MCLHRRDDIKGAVRKWQPGDGPLSNLNSCNVDPLLVGSRGHCHALGRMIDAIDLAFSGDHSQLTDGSASTAAYIEDDVLFPYRSMRQAPVRHLGVARI